MTLLTVSCEEDRNCSELSVVKDKIRSTMLVESMNYLSVLPIESDITKLLFIADAIEEYPAKELQERKY